MNGWIEDVGFVPLSDAELLRIRHALAERAATKRAAGFEGDALMHDALLHKLGGLHGNPLKIAIRTDEDQERLEG